MARKNTLAQVKGHIKRGKRIKAPTEDSYGHRATSALQRAGYDYRDGAWRPPRKRPSAPRGNLPTRNS